MSRHLGEDWVLPGLDPLNREYFTAGRIRVQHCESCGADQHPPEEICSSCRASGLGFRDAGDTGVVESAVLVQHPVHPGLKDQVPYAVAVISLDDAPGCNVIGNVVDLPRDEAPAIGQRVRARFETVQDEESGETYHIPQWETA